MAIKHQDRICRWISEVLTGAASEALVVALYHAAVDQTQRVVQTWKLKGEVEQRELGRLSSEIEDRFLSDAEALGGMQRYVLRARTRDGEELGSLTLRQSAGLALGAADSEPPNASGVVAMMQRHAEGSTRLLLEGFASVLSSQQDQIRAQGEMIANHQQQQAETFELQRRLLTADTEIRMASEAARAEREIEAMKEASREERKNKALQLVTDSVTNVMLPSIAHKMTGGKSGKSELEASLGEARRLFGGKSPDAVAAILDAAGDARPLFEHLYMRFKLVLEEETPAVDAGSASLDGVVSGFARAMFASFKKNHASLRQLLGPLTEHAAYESLSEAQRVTVGEVVAEGGEPLVLPSRANVPRR